MVGGGGGRRVWEKVWRRLGGDRRFVEGAASVHRAFRAGQCDGGGLAGSALARWASDDFIKPIKGQIIVFCSTKYRTRDVAKYLHQEKYNAVAIEGDMSQSRREQSMGKFRSGKADILVATDVASRGIDVPRVQLVVNYDVPNQENWLISTE